MFDPSLLEQITEVATTAGVALAAAGAAVGLKSVSAVIESIYSRVHRKNDLKLRLNSDDLNLLTIAESLTSEQAEALLRALEISSTKNRLSRETTMPSPSPSGVARDRVAVRIAEARGARKSQLSTARWSRWSSNLLTTAQVVIGGVLASSFVQEALTPKWVGGLGVLVLVSSLFKQQFHPEVDAENARKKGVLLQGLIRSSEDSMAILDAKIATGQDHTDAMIALMTQITQRLSEIENPE